MRYYFLLITMAFGIMAKTQVTGTTKIEEVVVYRNNAEITATSKVSLPAGTSEVLLKNISTSIQPSSLQVQIAGKNVTLLSAVYENNYIDQIALNEASQALQDKLDAKQSDLKWVRSQKQIYIDLETALNENKKLGGANVGYEAGELNTFLDIYKAKQFEYNKAIFEFEKEEEDLVEEVRNLQQQLNSTKADANRPSGVIKLQVSAVSPVSASFKCKYVISNAGWTPIYDLRSEGTNKDVSLSYKANIYQNSGYDWERVDLTVSTGNPTQNNNRPILNPQYLNIYTGGYYNGGRNERYKTEAEAPVMNMAYETIELADVELDYNGGYAYDADVQVNQLNVAFETSLPQTIPSDGKYHMVGLEEYELASEYIYHSVPKLDQGAFLLAKVSDWGKYNLLPGNANVFFEGAYVGKSYLDPNQTSDTLLLSMGRDEGIKVKRKQLVDYTETKFLGGNKKVTFAYEIEVRNTKNTPIEIEVLDQIPVSQTKEIVVELEESSGAEYNESIGKLEWNLTLGSNETKKLKLVYTVKYPKDQQVSGL